MWIVTREFVFAIVAIPLYVLVGSSWTLRLDHITQPMTVGFRGWSRPVVATLYLIGPRWSVSMRKKYVRVGFTPAQSAELWDRWRKGEGLTSIGRALGKPSSSIFNHLSPTGGIRSPGRHRALRSLTLAEREEISRGIVAQRSIRSMARSLGRAPSTVSREIHRNDGYQRYRAAAADKRAWKEALRPKTCKLAMYPCLRRRSSRIWEAVGRS